MPLLKAGAVLLQPQSPGLTPRACPGAGISIKHAEKQDSEVRGFSRFSGTMLNKAQAQSSRDGEKLQVRKAKGPTVWVTHSALLPFHRGLISFSQPRTSEPLTGRRNRRTGLSDIGLGKLAYGDQFITIYPGFPASSTANPRRPPSPCFKMKILHPGIHTPQSQGIGSFSLPN